MRIGVTLLRTRLLTGAIAGAAFASAALAAEVRHTPVMSPFRTDMDDEQIWYPVAYIRDLGRKHRAEGG